MMLQKWMIRLKDQTGGIIQLSFLLRKAIVNKFETSSYKTIKSALLNRNLKQALYDEDKVIMDGVLLTLHGEEHRKRENLNIEFSKRFLSTMSKNFFQKHLMKQLIHFKKGRTRFINFGYRITISTNCRFRWY